MKLGLGTVQFGMNYGITNTIGMVSQNEVNKILSVASSYGINTIDTAFSYGRSEEILGNVLKNNNNFNIITKTKPLLSNKVSNTSINDIARSIIHSFNRLQRNELYGLMVHNGEELLFHKGEKIFELLNNLKYQDRIKKIGVSVYSPETTNKILDRFHIDLIQFPINLLDQRMCETGTLKRLKSLGVETHARSVFLQGSLLQKLGYLPDFFQALNSQFRKLEEISKETNLSKLHIALNFLKKLPEIDKIIIGVVTHKQLLECIMQFNIEHSLPINYQTFSCNNPTILNPSYWNTCVDN